MKTTKHRIKMDTWLMGEPFRAGETPALTEDQVKQGLAAKTIEEVEEEKELPHPNGITEPIANPIHTGITQDPVKKLQGEITGDTTKSVEEAVDEADAGKSKKK